MSAVELGEAASRIVNDDAFQEAVQSYAKQIVSQWEACDNAEKREELWRQQKSLSAVVNNLAALIDNKDYELVVRAKKGLFR